MKKKILTVAAIVICLAILGTGTLAYFSDKEIAHNVITSGGVKIDLVEKMLDESGNRVDFRNNQSGLMPGATASKIVFVRNLDEPAWIRVKVVTEITAEDGQTALNPDRIVPNFDTANWLNDGEYYYYTKPVATGAATSDLFTQVHFKGEEMDNTYQNCTVNIAISAQAVQVANNPKGGIEILTAETLANVKGWPTPVEEALMEIFN